MGEACACIPFLYVDGFLVSFCYPLLPPIVVDLFDVQSNKEISLEEVMDGLRYVMEYRIKGGRFPSLDYDIMKRLADGLLMNMGNSGKKGRFSGGAALTEEADVAFQLFGEFMLEGKLSLLCLA